jgi:hypothetical protein
MSRTHEGATLHAWFAWSRERGGTRALRAGESLPVGTGNVLTYHGECHRARGGGSQACGRGRWSVAGLDNKAIVVDVVTRSGSGVVW